jgi:hypothetical protein
MKRILFPRTTALVLAVLLASMQTAAAQQKDAPSLKVTCDRADAIYRVGDTANFNIEALADVEFTWVASKDGFKMVNKGNGKLSKGSSSGIGVKLDEPGFLQIRVTGLSQISDGSGREIYAVFQRLHYLLKLVAGSRHVGNCFLQGGLT